MKEKTDNVVKPNLQDFVFIFWGIKVKTAEKRFQGKIR
jgi:hypothetical protein